MANSKLENISAISKLVSVVIVIVVVAVAAIGVVYISSARSGPSSGSNITCSSQSNNSAVQIAILSGASNSANGPGYNSDSITLVIGSNNTVTWTNGDSVHHSDYIGRSDRRVLQFRRHEPRRRLHLYFYSGWNLQVLMHLSQLDDWHNRNRGNLVASLHEILTPIGFPPH